MGAVSSFAVAGSILKIADLAPRECLHCGLDAPPLATSVSQLARAAPKPD
jgi:hypothetical protein